MFSCAAPVQYILTFLRVLDMLIVGILYVRGRPFDPEGGGGLEFLVGTDYLFLSRAWPENLFPGKPRTEYLFSKPQQIFEKATKNVCVCVGGGGGGVMLGFSTGGMTWLSMFNLHNFLQTTSTLLECFDSVFFQYLHVCVW